MAKMGYVKKNEWKGNGKSPSRHKKISRVKDNGDGVEVALDGYKL